MGESPARPATTELANLDVADEPFTVLLALQMFTIGAALVHYVRKAL